MACWLAFVLAVLQHGDPRTVFVDMAVVDNLSVFFHATFILIAFLTLFTTEWQTSPNGNSCFV